MNNFTINVSCTNVWGDAYVGVGRGYNLERNINTKYMESVRPSHYVHVSEFYFYNRLIQLNNKL